MDILKPCSTRDLAEWYLKMKPRTREWRGKLFDGRADSWLTRHQGTVKVIENIEYYTISYFVFDNFTIRNNIEGDTVVPNRGVLDVKERIEYANY